MPRTALPGAATGEVSRRMCASASALAAPETRSHTRSAELMVANDMVTRSGGGLGESLTANTGSSWRSTSCRPANRDATWVSGPRLSSARSTCGNPVGESSAAAAAASSSR